MFTRAVVGVLLFPLHPDIYTKTSGKYSEVLVMCCFQWLIVRIEKWSISKRHRRTRNHSDRDIQAMFMAESHFLLPQSPLSPSLGCECRSVSIEIHIDKSASEISRNEDWLYSTEAQHCPQRLQILEHLSFWLIADFILSLYFVYLKEAVVVKLPLRWEALCLPKYFYFVATCTERMIHRNLCSLFCATYS